MKESPAYILNPDQFQLAKTLQIFKTWMWLLMKGFLGVFIRRDLEATNVISGGISRITTGKTHLKN